MAFPRILSGLLTRTLRVFAQEGTRHEVQRAVARLLDRSVLATKTDPELARYIMKLQTLANRKEERQQELQRDHLEEIGSRQWAQERARREAACEVPDAHEGIPVLHAVLGGSQVELVPDQELLRSFGSAGGKGDLQSLKVLVAEEVRALLKRKHRPYVLDNLLCHSEPIRQGQAQAVRFEAVLRIESASLKNQIEAAHAAVGQR